MVGIYAMLHQPSGKSYIGGSRHIRQRIREHVCMLRNGTHPCSEFSKIWTWVVVVLEKCAAKVLRKREQFWMNRLDTFNEYLNAMDNPVIRKKLSDINRGRKLTPQHCQKIGDSKRGTKLSKETKKKISNSLAGKQNALGHKHTQEAKKKIGIASIGNKYAQGKKGDMNNGYG